MADERAEVKEINVTDGTSQKRAIEELVDAVFRTTNPSTALHHAAHAAIKTFRLLEHADQCRAADALAGHQEVMFNIWDREMEALKGESK